MTMRREAKVNRIEWSKHPSSNLSLEWSRMSLEHDEHAHDLNVPFASVFPQRKNQPSLQSPFDRKETNQIRDNLTSWFEWHFSIVTRILSILLIWKEKMSCLELSCVDNFWKHFKWLWNSMTGSQKSKSEGWHESKEEKYKFDILTRLSTSLLTIRSFFIREGWHVRQSFLVVDVFQFQQSMSVKREVQTRSA